MPPGVTPVAGPAEIFVHLGSHSVSPGSILTGDVAVVNSSTEFPVRAALRGRIDFADGSHRLLQISQPVQLAPQGSMVFQLFLPLPQDVPPGEGTLSVTAFVGYRPAPGAMSIHVARDADTFEVVGP